MSDERITRVRYLKRQFLNVQDFTDEQAYHLAMHRRHNIAYHQWGIVQGLELTVEEGEFYLKPGVAADGYGRELILPEQQPLPTKAFTDKGSDTLDIYLRYTRTASGTATDDDCAASEDSSAQRWQEAPTIEMVVPDVDSVIWRFVPESVVDFKPYQTPPDDPEASWPVYIGQIRRSTSDPKQPYQVDMSDRRYAGLVGSAIYTPSGQAWVDIGAPADNDRCRFGVSIATTDPERNPSVLEIDQEGTVNIPGRMTLDGDLTVGGKIDFRTGGYGDIPEPDTDQANPWRMYRVYVEIDNPDKVSDDDSEPERIKTEELRIEMPPLKGETRRSRVVIGTWSAQEKKFKPCLEIGNDSTVRVYGTLSVGHLINRKGEPIIRTSRTLTPDARRTVMSTYLAGVGGASSLLQRFYPEEDIVARLTTGVGLTPQQQATIRALTAQPGSMETMAQTLAENPAGLNDLVNFLAQRSPDVADRLRNALDQVLGR